VISWGYNPTYDFAVVCLPLNPLKHRWMDWLHGNMTRGENSSKKTTDLALQMTVLSVTRNEDAWFGWNNISSTNSFEDVGPNAV
jgi:hypothetical protein